MCSVDIDVIIGDFIQLSHLGDIESGTAQWLIFKSLILDSTHHQNYGKYTFPHLYSLWLSRRSK